MDIPKLRQEKELLKMQLELVRNQQSIVFEEIKIREKLMLKLKDENKVIQDKIQELAEIIDYSFLPDES